MSRDFDRELALLKALAAEIKTLGGTMRLEASFSADDPAVSGLLSLAGDENGVSAKVAVC